MGVAPDKEVSSAGRLRIALIASAERTPALAAAVDSSVLFETVGQAGMPQTAGLANVPWCNDPRVLIAEGSLEAVLLATSTRVDTELADLAAERGLHVWRLPPLARRFSKATEIITQSKALPTIYRVASWWEYIADHAWHELQWPAEFNPLYSELVISTGGPSSDAARFRLGEQAGGVLAQDGHELLEGLVALRGLPDSVAAATGRYRSAARATDGEAEDTALAILRYSDGGTALLRALWDLPPTERRLAHHGAGQAVTITQDEIVLSQLGGEVLDRRLLPSDFLIHDLMRFYEMARGQARDRATAPLERHLAVTALLEALYLSAMTGHPESPRKFYQLVNWPEPRP